MSSSRLLLLFLILIFLIIVILSSNRIAGALRTRFGNVIPRLQTITQRNTSSPTPTPPESMQPSATPASTQKGGLGFVPSITPKAAVNKPSEIPATGPMDVTWLLLGGSLSLGVTAQYFANRR